MGEVAALEARVVHASPGRIRLKVPRAALESTPLREAQRALRELAGIRDVRVNPLASSVIIVYDERAVDPLVLLGIATQAGVNVVVPAEEPSIPAEGTVLSERLTAFFRQLDRRVAHATGGTADLRTIVPISLFALGVREVLAGNVTALPWYVCFWYAFDSFLKLRRTESPPGPS